MLSRIGAGDPFRQQRLEAPFEHPLDLPETTESRHILNGRFAFGQGSANVGVNSLQACLVSDRAAAISPPLLIARIPRGAGRMEGRMHVGA